MNLCFLIFEACRVPARRADDSSRPICQGRRHVTRIVNHFNQDSADEIKAIKKLIKEADLDMKLIREQGHREVRQTFQQNPGPKLIKIRYEKAKEIRNSAASKATTHNIRHHGNQVIIKGGKM